MKIKTVIDALAKKQRYDVSVLCTNGEKTLWELHLHKSCRTRLVRLILLSAAVLLLLLPGKGHGGRKG